MKKLLLFVLLSAITVQAQTAFTDYLVIKSGNTAKEGVQIKLRTFSASTTDTTYGQDVRKFAGINVTLQSKDIVTILIKYQLSTDNVTWTTIATIDSLSQSGTGSTIKNVNVSTVGLGVSYIRFVFAVSANAFAIGTTTPVYTATFKKIETSSDGVTTVSGTATVAFASTPTVNQQDNGFVITDSLTIDSVYTLHIPYTANDNVGSRLLSFPNINSVSGGTVTITNVTVKHDTAAITTGLFSLLVLRDSVLMSRRTDNAAFALPTGVSADSIWKANFIEAFTIALTESYGLTGALSFSMGSANVSPFVCTPLGRNLYMAIVAKAALASKWKGKLWITVRGYRN
jgi:hypothetical protein